MMKRIDKNEMQSLLMPNESGSTQPIPNCNSSAVSEDSNDSGNALIIALPGNEVAESRSAPVPLNGSITEHDPIPGPKVDTNGDYHVYTRTKNEIIAEPAQNFNEGPGSRKFLISSRKVDLTKRESVMDTELNNDESVEDLTIDDTDTELDCAQNGDAERMEIKINPADFPLIEIEESPVNFEFGPPVDDGTVDPLQDISELQTPLSIPPNHRMCHTCGEFFPSSDKTNHCGPPEELPPSPREYPCSQCRKVFKREDLRDEHMFVHTSNQYICDRCGMFFGHKEDLTAHERTHKGITCPECQDTFNDRNEMDLHSKKMRSSIRCAPCDSFFWTKCSYNRHVRTHLLRHGFVAVEKPEASLKREPVNSQKANDPATTCEYCGRTYVNRNNLLRHLRKVTIPSSNRAKKTANSFPCNMCDEKFIAQCQLRKHNMEEHLDPLAITQNTAISAVGMLTGTRSLPFKAVAVGSTPRIQIFKHNQKGSKFQNTLTQYRNVSTGSTTVDVCHSSSTESTNNYRLKRIADNEAQCNLCGDTFSSVFRLNEHIRLVHSRPHQFACDICDKLFTNQENLDLHYVEHKSVRNKTCNQCGKMFASRRNVIRHQVVHERWASTPKIPETSALPTICSTSNDVPTPQLTPAAPKTPAFSPHNAMTYVELLTHVSGSRQPFHCEWCDRTFSYKRMYVEHYLSHTGEKPFVCEICNQRFVRERNMYSHMETHRKRKDSTKVIAWKSENPATIIPYHTVHASALRRTRKDSSTPASITYRSEDEVTDSSDLDACMDYDASQSIQAGFDEKLLLPPNAEEMFRVLPSVKVNKLDASLHENSVYVCGLCDKFFARPISLTGHKKTCSYLYKRRLAKELALKEERANKIKRAVPIILQRISDTIMRRVQFPTHTNDRFIEISNIQHRIVVENKEKFFVCGRCNQHFRRRYSLVEHCHKHTGEKPFPCKYCNSSFTRKSNLRKHVVHYHGEEPLYKSDMFDHIEGPTTDFEEKYANKMTIQKTESVPTINQVVEQTAMIDSAVDEDETENGSDPYCEIFEPQCIVKDEKSDSEEMTPYEDNAVSSCGGDRVAPYGDDRSVSYESSGIPPYGDGRVAPYGGTRVALDEDVRIAPYEERVAPYDDKLENASMNHFLELSTSANGFDSAYQNGGDCDNDTYESVDSVLLPDDEDCMPGSRFVCAQCNSTFYHREELLRHYSVHDSEKTFVCFYCKKEFARRKYLTKHALIHIRKKEHACTQCEKSYRTHTELMKHIRIHTGEKPFECDQCDKRFRENKQLLLHYRSHTGERPYVCGICSLSFFRPDTLSRHMRTCKVDTIMDVDID